MKHASEIAVGEPRARSEEPGDGGGDSLSGRPTRFGDQLLRELTRNDRFLSFRMIASLAVYAFLALSYIEVRINNDPLIYYDFMRRLVGENVAGYAYQFGTVFWNLPFYCLGRVISALGAGDTISGLPVGNISVAVASNVAVLLVFYLSWRLIRGLGLPGGPGAILLTVFGTPLFYYAIFLPGDKHAVDTLLISLLAVLLLKASEGTPSRNLCVALGAVLAFSINVRYANAVLLVGPLYVLVRARAYMQAYVVTTVAIVAGAAILAIPLLRGIPYGLPPTPAPAAIQPATPAAAPAASSGQPAAPAASSGTVPAAPAAAPAPARSSDITRFVKFDPLAPAKMLFTLKRGLFVWTPLTLFAVVGYILVLLRDERHRRFLSGLGLAGLALLLVHSVWGTYWTGGFSFSQRFLTGLFPIFVVGIAELLARTRMLVTPLLVACIAWSMFIALYHYYGYQDVSERDGVGRILELYTTDEETLGELWDVRVKTRIEARWHAYARWLEG